MCQCFSLVLGAKMDICQMIKGLLLTEAKNTEVDIDDSIISTFF